MTLDLGDWLPEFPVREHALYLDHAAVCPLPKSVATAMRRRITEQEETGHENYMEWRNNHLACRHLGSQLIGCDPADISIIRSTSEGLSLIAEGLGLKKKDEVLVGNEEFAANVSPWLGLERLGVKIIRFPQPDGRIDPQVIDDHIGESTKVLAVSWVAFHSGWIAPLAQLGRICNDRKILLVVDAIQGLGVLPMHMGAMGVDAVVADGHKWLLGPEGTGLMATTPELRSRLHPVISGWRNVVLAPRDYFLQRLEYHDDGRRFEAGAANDVGVAGLAAALDLIATIERENIQARVETLARRLTRILLAHGWEVFSPGSGQPIAGIVAARHPSVSPADARRRLRERRVVVSVRQGNVRFSPHFYTTKGELEALDRILEKVGL
jgi:selenocysteine lyase/cysteine desulfurase